PEALRRRPGTAYLTTVPSTRKAEATTASVQAVAPPVSQAHTMIAPRTRMVPGRIGTMIPAMPTAIRMPMTSSVRFTPSASHGHRQRDAHRPRTSVRGRCGRWCGGRSRLVSGARVVGQLVGLVDHGGRDLSELVTVLASVVGAEEELAAGLEL